jgi:hypothetical protein
MDGREATRRLSRTEEFRDRPSAANDSDPGPYAPIISSGLTYYGVSESPPNNSVLDLLTLRGVREYIRRSHGIVLVLLITVAYAVGSMVIGGMLPHSRVKGAMTR